MTKDVSIYKPDVQVEEDSPEVDAEELEPSVSSNELGTPDASTEGENTATVLADDLHPEILESGEDS